MSPRSPWEYHKPTLYAAGLYFVFENSNEKEILSKTKSVTTILVFSTMK